MHERNSDRDRPLVSLLEAKANSPPRPRGRYLTYLSRTALEFGISMELIKSNSLV